jgi:hypothetical protein
MGWLNAILLASELIELSNLAESSIHNRANACLIRGQWMEFCRRNGLTNDL